MKWALKVRGMLVDAKSRWQKRMYIYRLNQQRVSVPKSKIVVSYGAENGAMLEKGTSLTGGRVKLAYLQKRYPHNGKHYNILYLVSSALPAHAMELVNWAKKRGVTVFLNQNGVAYPAWTDNYQTINNELSQILCQADVVLYQSQFCKDAADKFASKCAHQWDILYNCADTDIFRCDVRQPKDVTTLLVAGTHYQRERVTLPLYVLKQLLDDGLAVTLNIVGRLAWENADSEVQELIRQLGLVSSVKISGTYTQVEAPAIYADADILLHLKYKDPCPNVLVEAMACGLPIIGSASGGVPELIGESAGVALPVLDRWDQMQYPEIEGIKDAVLKVLRDMSIFSHASRRRAEELFSEKQWIGRHEKLFAQHIVR